MKILRLLAAATYGSLLFATGCGTKHVTAPPIASDIPVSTVIDPQVAKNSPQMTAHPVLFTDVSGPAGLHWSYENGATGVHRMLEDLGGGVALLDYNNDGLLDIYAPQGGAIPGTGGSDKKFSRQGVLYRNNGDGTFTDVTEAAGLAGDHGYCQGVSVADYDNDGWPDIYVTAYGGNTLFHNNKNGTFTDVTAKAGIADRSGLAPGEPPWPLSSSWGDYDNDGRRRDPSSPRVSSSRLPLCNRAHIAGQCPHSRRGVGRGGWRDAARRQRGALPAPDLAAHRRSRD